jgi:hypothetical protein
VKGVGTEPAAQGLPQELAGSDPLQELLEEMAAGQPASVLDLAEQVNALEGGHRGDASTRPSFSLAPAEEPRPPSDPCFAAVLERIAMESGLLLPEGTPHQAAPTGPPAGEDLALLADLCGSDDHPVPDRASTQSAPSTAQEAEATPTCPTPEPRLGNLARSLHGLGLPPALCEKVLPTVNREGLLAELTRALRAALPPLPALPRSASSVMAVVGPARHVMKTARALAAEIGTPPEEVVLATARKTWSRRAGAISSPEAAAEHRRSWRWRPRPAVVAVEQPVRADGSDWAAVLLRALEPTHCWGVAEAARKPEDLAAWSEALGGLDALAIVDMEGTTTPAAALTCPVPVGRIDGEPATAEAWASLLCARTRSW